MLKLLPGKQAPSGASEWPESFDIRAARRLMFPAVIFPLLAFDKCASRWLYRHNSGLVSYVARLLSALGSERIFIPCAVIAASVALWQRHLAGAVALILVTIVTRTCIYAFKDIVRRPRPPFSELSSSSFPSGHTMAISAIYGTAAFVLTDSNRSLLPTIAVFSTLLAMAVGTARVIRGFHWLTDIAAGMISGLALFILVVIGL
ncbi:MAG: phosphatase PAP2 family protein [Deltaproteobacteria bacterium]|nr:phosphatase PAP2 family protein [Deltaproteobacteria bacterium]